MHLFPLLFAWPDRLDLAATAAFALVAIALPLTGYVFMFLDFRAWLKTLGRMLIHVRDYAPHIPQWARQETPRQLQVFSLRLPCTEEMLLRAYRQEVKKLHPDRGGDKRRFMVLQTHFEQALKFLRELEQQPATS
ncbi:MAG TPA: J domain-containing protein [Pirellulales bacterium]|jgi:hypothetical protein|nr:J domain-containing protein [Pirellulales bacterium]